jgi:hypothetical protein
MAILSGQSNQQGCLEGSVFTSQNPRNYCLAEDESTTETFIDQLLQHPLKVAGFKPIAREAIYERLETEPESSFIDTNVWLYAFIEGDDPQKSARAKLLIEASNTVIVSIHVINEVCVNLIKKAQFLE